MAVPQFAQVEQPLGHPPPVVHCPICGNAVTDPEGVDPCDHLAFMFYADDFGYMSEDFSGRLEKAEMKDVCFSLDGLKPLLGKLGYGNTMLAIESTYGGMARRPSWTTDVYGFDFGVPRGDDEA